MLDLTDRVRTLQMQVLAVDSDLLLFWLVGALEILLPNSSAFMQSTINNHDTQILTGLVLCI